jgi:hypothetical protein
MSSIYDGLSTEGRIAGTDVGVSLARDGSVAGTAVSEGAEGEAVAVRTGVGD